MDAAQHLSEITAPRDVPELLRIATVEADVDPPNSAIE
jgi:hypothetical protein